MQLSGTPILFHKVALFPSMQTKRSMLSYPPALRDPPHYGKEYALYENLIKENHPSIWAGSLLHTDSVRLAAIPQSFFLPPPLFLGKCLSGLPVCPWHDTSV